ncbi:uncharacterized protein [Mytilus edulis]|uniref:uncharacterized protein isoform X1 n=1 Tax=Mytilus edulis TaxID=6550 RepID=UPI0039EFE39F
MSLRTDKNRMQIMIYFGFFLFTVSMVSASQNITCEIPCELRGKTLDIFIGTDIVRGYWTFENDGVTSSYTVAAGSSEFTNVLTCYERIERFILFRVDNLEEFVCYIFDYNSGMTPISFSFGTAAKTFTTATDACELCHPQGGFRTLTAIEVGYKPTNPASLPCDTVSYCSGESHCGANDTLPEGCTTTTIATITEPKTDATTKPTKRCHKRRHHP